MRNINKHIIHCSDSSFGDVKEIRKWHKARGFNDVGYHFIIRRDGEIEVGRLLNKMGAHCKGYNRHSVGTCLIGIDKFTQKQFKTLNNLHAMLKGLFPEMTLHGHHEFNQYKSCPNFNPQERVTL